VTAGNKSCPSYCATYRVFSGWIKFINIVDCLKRLFLRKTNHTFFIDLNHKIWAWSGRKKFFFSSSFLYTFKMWNLKLMLWKACQFISSPHRSTIGARSDQMASKSLVETQVHYLWVGNLPPYPLLPSITVKCFYFFMRHHVWEFSLVFSVGQLFCKDSK